MNLISTARGFKYKDGEKFPFLYSFASKESLYSWLQSCRNFPRFGVHFDIDLTIYYGCREFKFLGAI